MSPGSAELSDGELWHRASEHAGAAFGALFERHSTAVYNHCFRRTGSWSTAQDLTSVVFLEAWRRKKDVILTGDSILPWLLAVANNVVRNSDRSLRRHRRLLAKLPAAPVEPPFDDEASQRVDDERAMKSVLGKLRTLRMEEQEIVALCDWSNLTYSEAATVLAVPVGTVRSRLSRAHEHLRVLMGEEEDPDRPSLEQVNNDRS